MKPILNDQIESNLLHLFRNEITLYNFYKTVNTSNETIILICQ